MPIAKTKAEREANMREILQSRTPPGLIKPRTMEAFKSHVDGTVVTNQSELEAHNRRNDVIDVREWGNPYFCDLDAKKEREARINGTSKIEKKKRTEDIIEAVQKVEQGYKPIIGQQEEV